MNNKALYFLLASFSLTLIVGCNRLVEEDDFFKGTMQARINGDLIVFGEAYGNRSLSWEDFTLSGIINIVGLTDQRASGYEIQVGFPSNPAMGVIYHPNCMFRPWVGNYYDYQQTAYFTRSEISENERFSSTLTFSSVNDKRFKGAFSFTAYLVDKALKDSVVVREGKFEIDSGGKKF